MGDSFQGRIEKKCMVVGLEFVGSDLGPGGAF